MHKTNLLWNTIMYMHMSDILVTGVCASVWILIMLVLLNADSEKYRFQLEQKRLSHPNALYKKLKFHK